MEDILAITFLFGGGALFLISISPVGRAIADRIRQRGSAAAGDELTRLRDGQLAMFEEMERLREEVAELHEQVDFTERMLARGREERLPPGGEDGTQRS
jgi:hypothetical protein